MNRNSEGVTGYGIDRMCPEASCYDLDNLVSCFYPCNKIKATRSRQQIHMCTNEGLQTGGSHIKLANEIR